ncbi:PAS domain S-box protein [Geomonas sp. RF6]|uniref:PAS domain S-box protein n=1 Tax=Geomonas sp. RF6 TaxID=2897342 RepID=UPI001E44FEB2|nr:PAS domain S-box protein [Geomonas sp. RF6]UFS69606.1 PAS domain S-box protein [Geomonas sp. RF6]
MAGTGAKEAPLKLLYVEDEPITREVVCTLVGRKFPQLVVVTAENGKAGMELFLEQDPDFVITDIKMPVLHGIEMARQIKGLRSNIPIIVTTAHSDMEFLMDAIEIGISQYVLKPIEREKLFSAIQNCITRIELERQVQRQQAFIAKLSCAVEQSPSTIIITDREGTIEYVNPKFTALTGYTAEEAVGENPRLLKAGTTPEETYEELWVQLMSGREWHGELENRKKNGELYWESVSISPILDSSGGVINFVAVKEDITERKRAQQEIEDLNRKLAARASELEAANQDLESFGYTVSHDLRTPLTNINGYCQVILEMYGESLDEQCREFVQIMLTETLSMSKLIKTLLDFSRLARQELKRGPVDLSALAGSIATDLKLRHLQRRLNFRIAPDLEVVGDADLLRVALTNLLGNACKYSAKKEESIIEFGSEEKEGKSVYFVRDNGAGFDMAYYKKLFKVFQRLHSTSEFEGTGIGLATVHRVIQRHGGTVWAEGAVEQGATFYFTLG